MNLNEFEIYYRNKLDRSLNQLQTVVLLMSRLENTITSISQDLQDMSEQLEEFVNEQKS